MDFAQFARSCSDPEPAYLLKTDDDYLKRRVFEHCRDQVGEAARAFDWTVFDLKEEGEVDLVNAARTLPWMGKRRWIYVRNAEAATDELTAYLKRPAKHTVLLLECKRKPSGWPRLAVIEMPEGLSPLDWIQEQVKRRGYEMDREAVQVLNELVGDDLQKLSAVLEKLFLYTYETRRIDKAAVFEMTSQSRDYDIFSLISALASGQGAQALVVLNRLFDAGMSPPQIISTLYWSFGRLLVAREMMERGEPFFSIVKQLQIWSYRNRERELRRTPPKKLVEVLIRLREVDRSCKMTSADERMLLERLIIDTCRRRSL